jgi:hypothetical protein
MQKIIHKINTGHRTNAHTNPVSAVRMLSPLRNSPNMPTMPMRALAMSQTVNIVGFLLSRLTTPHRDPESPCER